jgi:hypothetical protein
VRAYTFEGAIARKNGHDVEPVVCRRVRESGRVPATRRFGELDLVMGRKHLADHDALAGSNRRRRRIHEQQHAHLKMLPATCP